MPNILPGNQRDETLPKPPLTLDDLRQNPARFVTLEELARMGVFRSYGTPTRWVKQGKLAPPYRINNRNTWEGRHIVAAVDRSRRAAA